MIGVVSFFKCLMRNSKIESPGEGKVQTKLNLTKKFFDRLEASGYVVPLHRGSEASGSADVVAVPSPSFGSPLHRGSEASASADAVAVPSPSFGSPSHESMLKTVYDHTIRTTEQEAAAKNWKQHLPAVAVKREWLEVEMPKMKREDGVKRASTPKLFKQPVHLNAFKSWLESEAKGEANATIILRGARRAMSALEIDEACSIEDVKV